MSIAGTIPCIVEKEGLRTTNLLTIIRLVIMVQCFMFMHSILYAAVPSVIFGCIHYILSLLSERSKPTLGYSIKISHDIHVYVSVCLSCPKCVGRITWPTRMLKEIFVRLIKTDLRHRVIHSNYALEQL